MDVFVPENLELLARAPQLPIIPPCRYHELWRQAYVSGDQKPGLQHMAMLIMIDEQIDMLQALVTAVTSPRQRGQQTAKVFTRPLTLDEVKELLTNETKSFYGDDAKQYSKPIKNYLATLRSWLERAANMYDWLVDRRAESTNKVATYERHQKLLQDQKYQSREASERKRKLKQELLASRPQKYEARKQCIEGEANTSLADWSAPVDSMVLLHNSKQDPIAKCCGDCLGFCLELLSKAFLDVVPLTITVRGLNITITMPCPRGCGDVVNLQSLIGRIAGKTTNRTVFYNRLFEQFDIPIRSVIMSYYGCDAGGVTRHATLYADPTDPETCLTLSKVEYAILCERWRAFKWSHHRPALERKHCVCRCMPPDFVATPATIHDYLLHEDTKGKKKKRNKSCLQCGMTFCGQCHADYNVLAPLHKGTTCADAESARRMIDPATIAEFIRHIKNTPVDESLCMEERTAAKPAYELRLAEMKKSEREHHESVAKQYLDIIKILTERNVMKCFTCKKPIFRTEACIIMDCKTPCTGVTCYICGAGFRTHREGVEHTKRGDDNYTPGDGYCMLFTKMGSAQDPDVYRQHLLQIEFKKLVGRE